MNEVKKLISFTGEALKVMFYALMLSLFIRALVYQPFSIPSSSMLPTLLIGDYIFVSKFSYGYSRYSLPLSLDLFEGRVLNSEIKRGDVAVFRPPTMTSTDYIKRVIGLPGDLIEITSDNNVSINGQILMKKFDGHFPVDKSYGNPLVYIQYIETMPNGRSYRILHRKQRRSWIPSKKFEVPEEHYFVMGDNRDESVDSRGSVVGMVPVQNFVGRADVIFMSIKGNENFIKFWLWPENIRWQRIPMTL